MKKIFFAVLILCMSLPAFAETNVALVFATGGLGDKAFNDTALAGIQRAQKEYHINFDYAEPVAITEYETYLAQFANAGRYALIICIGFDQADALTKISTRFPRQRFAIIDMVVKTPNVASYVYKEKERGFMMGYAAALMTTRSKDPRINAQKSVGGIGGMKIPLIDANIAGFIAGARYADKDVTALHAYVGHWADPGKARSLPSPCMNRAPM